MKMSWSAHKIYSRASQAGRISALKNVCKILTCHLYSQVSQTCLRWLFQGTPMYPDWVAATTTSFLSSPTSRPLSRLPQTGDRIQHHLRRRERRKKRTLLWRQPNLHVITPDSRYPKLSYTATRNGRVHFIPLCRGVFQFFVFTTWQTLKSSLESRKGGGVKSPDFCRGELNELFSNLSLPGGRVSRAGGVQKRIKNCLENPGAEEKTAETFDTRTNEGRICKHSGISEAQTIS